MKVRETQIFHKRLLTILILIVFLISLASVFFYFFIIPSPLLSTFPSITKTKSDRPGDPINIVFLGDKVQVLRTFAKAHWLIPDPIDEKSTIKIIKTSIINSSYPTAPMSNLYLFGKIQDLAFEYPTNTVRKRHHVRLWETTKQVLGKPIWIGAASFDSGIELSSTTHFPTHHISSNIDTERDFLTNSLAHTRFAEHSQLERITFPVIVGHNGGGDWYFDDGNAVVIVLQ